MAPICAGGIFYRDPFGKEVFRFQIFSRSGGANSQSICVNPMWIQISVDPDQRASFKASRSGSTLFRIKGLEF